MKKAQINRRVVPHRPGNGAGTGNSHSSALTRILIASHSHPRLSKGGAEIAAFQLYDALQRRPGFESWFLGCVRDQMNQKLGATISQPFTEREYLYSGAEFDWFKFANRDAKFPREFRALLEQLQPQILHFHHYLNFGVEAFLHVRETLPSCKIIVTLHEYLAICHHFGQMITRPDRTLCYEANPTKCSSCFTELTPSDFSLRTWYIRRFFDLVDHFVAPSHFLADRYIAWGIPKDRMSVIENLVVPSRATNRRPEANGRGGLLRVGFFGQISALKGINVFLEAAEIMEQRKVTNIVFEIYGDYSGAPPDFQAEFISRLKNVGRNVKFHGPYDQYRVDALMQAVDLVVVPSIWWENSPLVIQEALRNRRPIVCSDVGGMAEKVRDGIDGYHFPVGNSIALASLLLQLVETPGRLMSMGKTIGSPATTNEITDRYAELYASLS
jgi:glycosyltransferase involved in cell wall biosynthesis